MAKSETKQTKRSGACHCDEPKTGKTVTLQVVDYGEDARVKMVDYGEDVSFEKVSGWASSSTTIRIKVVDYCEDVRLKQVSYGGCFKAIIK